MPLCRGQVRYKFEMTAQSPPLVFGWTTVLLLLLKPWSSAAHQPPLICEQQKPCISFIQNVAKRELNTLDLDFLRPLLVPVFLTIARAWLGPASVLSVNFSHVQFETLSPAIALHKLEMSHVTVAACLASRNYFSPLSAPAYPPRPSHLLRITTTMEDIIYRPYSGETDLPHIVSLVQNELSEPYVIYTYRYFLHQWPHLSFLAYPADHPTLPIGVIVCKQSMHRENLNRGYIAMLSVSKNWRKRGIASTLVRHSIDVMKINGVEEIALETEYDNAAALALYASLGFIREKRLFRFYLNGKDAFRLILAFGDGDDTCQRSLADDDDDGEPQRLERLRWKVSTLRASRMVALWPPDEDEDSGR
ncbi:hypothetical protein EW146_g10345 [Bondarzewia mesenterica]|uniref:N-acetyltransferase domain-containing protein n=1 Tax=Bondarzewia mesenterica TaxID=1095465 RepID=A0A4S4KY18_9AGAM|nr:hypothetical protein EW146_g10345 [Bondarzewia mesenterica]